MRKIGVVLGLFLLSILIVPIMVSAASDPLAPVADIFNSAISAVVSVLKPILEVLVGELAGSGTAEVSQFFLAKLLMVVIVFSVTYAVLNMTGVFSNTRWVLWVGSFAVSIIGVRFLTPEMIRIAVLPNSAFAVALTAIIPFILWAFITLRVPSRALRRTMWVFFAVIFFGIWAVRSEQLANDGTSFLGTLGYIYPVAGLLALLMAVFDGTLRKWWNTMKAEKALSAGKYEKYLKNLKERDELYELYLDSIKRYGAGDPNTTTLKAKLDNLDTAIIAAVP